MTSRRERERQTEDKKEKERTLENVQSPRHADIVHTHCTYTHTQPHTNMHKIFVFISLLLQIEAV